MTTDTPKAAVAATPMTPEQLAVASALASVDTHPPDSTALQRSHRELLVENKRLNGNIVTVYAANGRLSVEVNEARGLLALCDVSARLVRRVGLTLATALAGYQEGHEDRAHPDWPDDVEGDDERAAYICNITIDPMACLKWLLANAGRLDEMAAMEPTS